MTAAGAFMLVGAGIATLVIGVVGLVAELRARRGRARLQRREVHRA